MKLRSYLFQALLAFFMVACASATRELSDAELRDKAAELALKYIIVDGHVDLPYRMQVRGFTLHKEAMNVAERTEGGNFDYPRAREGGLDAPFMSIYIPARYQRTGGAKALADSLIRMTERLTQTWPDKFAMAYSPDDVEKNFAEGKISLPMGMENGAPVENNLEDVAYFHQRGIRYITLTHSRDNKICDSSYDTTGTHGGLSAYGRSVVAEMNRVGIMIDISHVSDNTFWQVMERSRAPVIASHSSSRHFTPGFERNMGDEMIRKLGENDGVIMINFGSSFLDGEYRARKAVYDEHIINWLADRELTRDAPEAKAYIDRYTEENDPWSNVAKVADHIDRVVELTGGTEHVGFGSDFDGVGDSLPTGLKDVSQFPNLIYELLKRGYSEKDIANMCYKNVFRVWREVERVASAS